MIKNAKIRFLTANSLNTAALKLWLWIESRQVEVRYWQWPLTKQTTQILLERFRSTVTAHIIRLHPFPDAIRMLRHNFLATERKPKERIKFKNSDCFAQSALATTTTSRNIARGTPHNKKMWRICSHTKNKIFQLTKQLHDVMYFFVYLPFRSVVVLTILRRIRTPTNSNQLINFYFYTNAYISLVTRRSSIVRKTAPRGLLVVYVENKYKTQ